MRVNLARRCSHRRLRWMAAIWSVGSNRAAVEGAIRAASPLPVPVKISVTADGIAADTERASRRLRPVVVSYDPEQATDVGAGENSGARLREYPDRTVGGDAGRVGWRRAATIAETPPERGQGLVVLVAGEDLRIAGAADRAAESCNSAAKLSTELMRRAGHSLITSQPASNTDDPGQRDRDILCRHRLPARLRRDCHCVTYSSRSSARIERSA